MVLLPDGKKKFEDMFIRFDVIHERDRQTDRQTDGHRVTAKTALMQRPRLRELLVYGNKTDWNAV